MPTYRVPQPDGLWPGHWHIPQNGLFMKMTKSIKSTFTENSKNSVSTCKTLQLFKSNETDLVLVGNENYSFWTQSHLWWGQVSVWTFDFKIWLIIFSECITWQNCVWLTFIEWHSMNNPSIWNVFPSSGTSLRILELQYNKATNARSDCTIKILLKITTIKAVNRYDSISCVIFTIVVRFMKRATERWCLTWAWSREPRWSTWWPRRSRWREARTPRSAGSCWGTMDFLSTD